jgi:hypothetical protein
MRVVYKADRDKEAITRAGVAFAVLALLFACVFSGNSMAADDDAMKRMEEINQKQQEQLESQAKEIKDLQKQVGTISETSPQVAAKQEKNVDGKLKLDLYGWINKGFMVSDDGDSTDYYVVDPGQAGSRFGALGSIEASDDITVGTRLEFDYDHNRSSSVNQENKNNVGDNKFRDRWVDLQLTSKRFGKFYIGKGSTASDSTSESDLSGTSVAMYSSLTDSAGALYFYDKDTNSISTTQINNVFTHLDGLGRDDRIRYDTPKFGSFQFKTSVLSGDGGDVAVTYAAKLGEDVKVAAAAGWSDPQGQDDSVDNRYSSSASILHSSGWSFSLTANKQELDDNSRDDPTELYTKVGFRSSKLFDVGESRFSVDYARHEDQDQDGDEGTAVGFAFLQDIPQFASEYWLAYRWHELDRDDADFEDLSFFQTGWRLKF